MAKFNDDSLMPWGKHKGVRLTEVPDQYLLWLYKARKAKGDVLDYIEDNLDAIKSNLNVDKIEFDDE